MKKKHKNFLFDLTLLRPESPNRGIPKVINDVVNVIESDSLCKKHVRYVVEKNKQLYVKNLYPNLANRLVPIKNNPIDKFMFVGFLSEFRYNFSHHDYSFIFHPYLASIRFFSKIPQVLIVYDLIHLKNWKNQITLNKKISNIIVVLYLLYKHYKMRICENFFCISKYTKNDFLSFYPSAINKTTVIPLKSKKFPGYSKIDVNNIFLPEGDKLLYVGGLDERKNVENLVSHVGDFCEKNGCALIIAGSASDAEIFSLKKLISNKKLNNVVYFYPNVSDKELSYIYDASKIFVFFSKYEGFGLPVIEALSKGLPVIAFNNSSITELLSESGILIENENYEKFIQVLGGVLENPTQISELIEKGKRIVELYGDENFNNSIINIIKKYNEEEEYG